MSYLVSHTCDLPCITCKLVGTKIILAREAEVCCTNCGTVSETSLMDGRQEHRAYTDDTGRKEDPSHVGMPEKFNALFGPSLGCTSDNSTPWGKRLAKITAESRRLAPSGKPPPPRGVVSAIKDFERIAASAKFPDNIIQIANEMFTEFIDKGCVAGPGRKTAYAVCIYYSSNSERKRSLREISTIFDVKNITHMCNTVHNALVGREQWKSFFLDRVVKGIDVVQRMFMHVQSKIPSKLHKEVKLQCDKIWTMLNNNDKLDRINNSNPEGVSVAVIFTACAICNFGDIQPKAIMAACKAAGYTVCANRFNEHLSTICTEMCRVNAANEKLKVIMKVIMKCTKKKVITKTYS
ncbi:Transcription initiation factor IIB [Tetrabaena socialis]|uniref:Transcription initiation factor IIB n=1 Tax=Tetrabaena socialis TaxID=47790 RepID=A0A2J8AJB0_9CHLO|nr:Transcription initiation factor IIB [Tetrabaena socialis]|eukprot:PNH12593.1 Transcription initiation factor IIB [Tetrabaena socialis]